ncbi:hypothetical protein COOONC_22732 [Cooperia oncophora]
MDVKTMRKQFLFALACSVFAILSIVIAVPLVLTSLDNLKADVDGDMKEFKASSIVEYLPYSQCLKAHSTISVVEQTSWVVQRYVSFTSD